MTNDEQQQQQQQQQQTNKQTKDSAANVRRVSETRVVIPGLPEKARRPCVARRMPGGPQGGVDATHKAVVPEAVTGAEEERAAHAVLLHPRLPRHDDVEVEVGLPLGHHGRARVVVDPLAFADQSPHAVLGVVAEQPERPDLGEVRLRLHALRPLVLGLVLVERVTAGMERARNAACAMERVAAAVWWCACRRTAAVCALAAAEYAPVAPTRWRRPECPCVYTEWRRARRPPPLRGLPKGHHTDRC